jgi:hypothetical protein
MVTYIYRLQQMEASAIAVNKTDQIGPNELGEVVGMLQMQFPKQRILSFSAATGDGFDAVAEWLLGDELGILPASPPIDYDVYAEGEAELAWFDGRFDIVASTPIDMDDALTTMGSLLRERILLAGLEIAHVKMLLRTGERTCALSITRNDAQPSLSLRAAGNATALELVVNARVAARPEVLRTLVEECLESWGATIAAAVSERTASAFSPGRPVPTHRVG